LRVSKHTEGRTRLFVPAASLTEVPPPTSPVFYNPAAALNRDVSVTIAAAAGGATFCDSMAGVGARGVRVAKEVEGIRSVSLVDFNREALKLARRSALLNRVSGKCVFSESETSSFLFSRYGSEQRFDYVDVDPFGSPVRQLQAALCATADGGMLSVTATDTAVLCGVYPEVVRRRYGAAAINNHFNHETAVRILTGAIARAAAQLDIGVEPAAAHSTRHYVRVYARVRVGASKADTSVGNLGYVSWCRACGHAVGSVEPVSVCEKCGKKARVAGPLWLAPLTEAKLLADAARLARSRELSAASELMSSLEGVDGYPPWCFSIEGICSSLKVATAPEDGVYKHLVGAGHRVMRTPFEKTGIKTDADYGEVRDAVRSAASDKAPRPPSQRR
jgi:tRNA (guanine26-N2/guanine27-N2)-dimethyltransferase